MPGFHVSIIGAGLGGLCLAQALKQAGIAFDVFERDPIPGSRLQGYRIRIDGNGQRALAASLPPRLYALFRQTCAIATSPGKFLSPRLQPTGDVSPESWNRAAIGEEEGGEGGDVSANRLTLREILLCGIEEHVHFGNAFAHFVLSGNGTVGACFDNGNSIASTVLVGADGVNSHVRQQLAPAAAPVDTGAVCIYGKTMLPGGRDSDATLLDRGTTLDHGTTVIFGDGCAAIFDAMHFAGSFPELAAERAPNCRLTQVDDYLYWALTAPASRIGLTIDNEGRPPMELSAIIAAATHDWHPLLRQAFRNGDPATLALLPIRSGRPEVEWASGPVTLLGDAIHAMSPAGGLGANTALVDAVLLATALAGAAANSRSVAAALAAYQTDMRERALRALAASSRGAALLYATTHSPA